MDEKLVKVLEDMNSNEVDLTAAYDYMRDVIATEYAEVVLALSRIMAKLQWGTVVRNEAGRVLMDVFCTYDIKQMDINKNRWLGLPVEIRHQIKAHCCQALAMQDLNCEVDCVAGIVIADLAAVDTPQLIDAVLANILSEYSTDTLKENSIEAIKYIGIYKWNDPKIFAPKFMDIFNSMLWSLDDHSNHIRLRAAETLRQVLRVMIYPFNNKELLHQIMIGVCAATRIACTKRPDERIAEQLLNCVVELMRSQYTTSEDEVQHGLVQHFIAITEYALRSPLGAIVQQGITLWSTALSRDLTQFLPKIAVEFLVPSLIEIVLRQEEGDDEWKPQKAAEICLGLLSKKYEEVRWTVGRVYDLLPKVALGNTFHPALLHALVAVLSSEPKGEERTYELHHLFSKIVEQLLHFTKWPHCCHSDLRHSAYSALMKMIRSAPQNCYAGIQHITVVVLQKLDGILGMEQAALSAQDRSQLAEYQSLLCEALKSVLRKIDRADVQNIADQIISVLMVMFERAQAEFKDDNNPADSFNRYRRIQEDALLALKALIVAIGPAFGKHMNQFMPVLLACLQNSAQSRICSIAVDIICDLVHQVVPQLVPYLGKVFPSLFNTIGNKDTDRSLLPEIISAFGYFAMFLGDSFAEYRDEVIKTLIQACQAEVDINDPNMIEFLNLLRQSCIKAFVRVIVGAAAQEEIEKFRFIIPHMEFIIEFMGQIGAEHRSSKELIEASCFLVRVIATVFGKDSLKILHTESINGLLDRGLNCQAASTKEHAARAILVLNKLRDVEEEGGRLGT